MSLKLLQDIFIQQLTREQNRNEFSSHLKPCGNLLPAKQLAIYQNNIRGTLQKTLVQVYPTCRVILGEKYFEQLASYYIHEYPSKHPGLNCYGEWFFLFMKSQCQKRSELYDFSYLSDLALLEWFRQQVYYAAEGSTFYLEGFSQLTEEQQAQTIFHVNPCLKLIQSDYPILSLWQINQRVEETQQLIVQKPEICSVYRKHNHVEMANIDINIYSALKLITNGAVLSEIVQAGFAELLPALISRGWVDRFKVKHV